MLDIIWYYWGIGLKSFVVNFLNDKGRWVFLFVIIKEVGRYVVDRDLYRFLYIDDRE